MEPESTLIIALSDSPWNGFTTTSEEEEAGKLVMPGVLDPHWERVSRLDSLIPELAPLLAINRKARTVRLSRDFFSSWVRGDATIIESDEAVLLGNVKGALAKKNPEQIFRYILESHLVITSIHIESRLIPGPVQTLPDGSILQRFKGEHIFFTQHENRKTLDFALRIEFPQGEVWLEGADA